MADAGWVRVAAVADVAEGQVRGVRVGGREIALYHLPGGDYRATDNICSHEYAQLSDGWLENGCHRVPAARRALRREDRQGAVRAGRARPRCVRGQGRGRRSAGENAGLTMPTGATDGQAIDCDLHPTVPAMSALMPYLDEVWRETVVRRGIDELNTIAYPSNSPLTVRSDWRDAGGQARDHGRAAGHRGAGSVRHRASPSATASTACRRRSARTSAPPWRAR